MKTIKRIFLFAFSLLLLSSTATLNAQVTIGDEKAPEEFSILELISNTGGLRLPQLTTTQRDALAVSGKPLAKGLTIFNTDIDCMETWNGIKWLSNCGNDLSEQPPLIVLQPQSQFIIKDNWGSATPSELKITAVGLNLSYQWFKADGTEITGATNSTFTPTDAVSFSPNVYYCEVYNSYGMVASKRASIVKACTAKGNNSRTLYFLCHNVGADVSKDPLTPSADIHGGKYKWGLKSSGLNQTDDQTITPVDDNWTNRGTPPVSSEWDMINQNPCPAGWRVPPISVWSQVINTKNNPNITRKGSWTLDDMTSGYLIGSDLYLPAAGYRQVDGRRSKTGQEGWYWAANAQSAGKGWHVGLKMTEFPIYSSSVTYGQTIRCMSE